MSTPFDENNSASNNASNNTGADANPSNSTWQMTPPSSSASDPTAANAPYGQQAYGAQYGQYQQQGYQQQGYQQQGYYPGQPDQLGQPLQAGSTKNPNSFFGKLFDLSFKRFVTLDSARVIYILALVLIGLFWLVGLFFAFGSMLGLSQQGSTGAGIFFLFMYLILGTFWSFIQVVFARLGIEALVNLYRTAENTTELVEQGKADSEKDGQEDTE